MGAQRILVDVVQVGARQREKGAARGLGLFGRVTAEHETFGHHLVLLRSIHRSGARRGVDPHLARAVLTGLAQGLTFRKPPRRPWRWRPGCATGWVHIRNRASGLSDAQIDELGTKLAVALDRALTA